MTSPEIIPPEDKPKRPGEFTDEIFQQVCDRMAGGEGLRKICEDPQMPSRQTFLRWIEKDSGRQAQYTAAREALMDWYAEEILTIAWDSSRDTIPADGKKPARCDNEWVNRSRLKVDTLKFLMAKLHPKRYGDKPPEQQAERDLKISWQNASEADRINRIELVGIAANGGTVADLMAAIDGRTRTIERDIVSPIHDDNGNIINASDASGLRKRIKELEDRIAGREASARSADKPLAIAYNPTPPPADLSPEAWSAIARVSDLIEQIAPGGETPEHVFGLIEGFLRSHYVQAA